MGFFHRYCWRPRQLFLIYLYFLLKNVMDFFLSNSHNNGCWVISFLFVFMLQ
jgi:hypothetical protein